MLTLGRQGHRHVGVIWDPWTRHRRAEARVVRPEREVPTLAATRQQRTGWSVTSAVAAAVLVGLAAYAFCTALRDAAAIYAYAARDDEADSV